MVRNIESVGIVGVGDLGSQLAVQIGSVVPEVHLFDPSVSELPKDVRGVDLVTDQSEMLTEPFWHKTVDSLLDSVTIIHWCAPLYVLNSANLLPEQTLVLHDSVMAHSREAKEALAAPSTVNIVHLLMNRNARVAVSTDSDDHTAMQEHVTAIGLNPVLMSTDEHDANMAISQAPMAILHHVLGENLAALRDAGLLTPSGEDLAAALQDRAARWTDVTLAAILSNPQIPNLIENMRRQITPEE